MRIAWIGPFAAKSADARYCYLTVAALRDLGHVVTVFRSDGHAGADTQPYDGEITPAETLVGRDDIDIVFYTINDNFASYGPVYALMEQRPGIVVFLSWFLYNYYRGYMASIGRGGIDVITTIEDLYGRGRFLPDLDMLALPINEMLRRIDATHPMGEWVARHAIAGVAHAHFYLEPMRAACRGPVMMAPLAYRAEGPPPARPDKQGAAARLVTLGVMNANKRVESVIRAIAATPRLRAAVEYRCVGPIAEPQQAEWQTLAEELGVQITFTGYVEEPVMRAELAAADAIACLRDPALEGGSGSVLETMLSARPVIVTRAGCYQDIPDDLVRKVDPDREIEMLTEHLLALLDDPAAGQAMADRARAWTERTHAPRTYAEALAGFADRVLAPGGGGQADG